VLRFHRSEGSRPGRRLRRTSAVLMVLVVGFAAWLVIPAMLAPGNDSLGAKIAENARDHGLGFIVTGAESLQYRLSPPQEGGSLDAAAQRSLSSAGNAPSPEPAGSSAPSAASPAMDVDGAPPAVEPVARPALAGEGVYATRVVVNGRPAVRTALLRPDAVHTSYLAGVAWMSASRLRFVQHPGATDPGQLARWSEPAVVPPERRTGLVATFNSGFKIADSRGAFYADGRSVGRLRPGAASLVVYADGHVDIGAWGSDVRMTPDVRTVRQNLGLLLADGKATPEVNDDTQATWGATIGQKAYVWRSGIGVTASGDVVFVAGDALSAATLATLLQRAGAVRAMELDINRSWVSFMWYSTASPASPAAPAPHKLVDFARPADRYFTVNNRDFFAVYAR